MCAYKYITNYGAENRSEERKKRGSRRHDSVDILFLKRNLFLQPLLSCIYVHVRACVCVHKPVCIHICICMHISNLFTLGQKIDIEERKKKKKKKGAQYLKTEQMHYS